MEFAVALQSIRDLNLVKEPWRDFPYQNKVEAELQSMFFAEWNNTFGENVNPQRIIFGSEFCQYRIPSKRAVNRALQYCLNNELSFSFATPYIHEQKFDNLKEILALLNETALALDERIEVIVNDWGVYYQIQNDYPYLDVVIGRLLNKSIRDPRVAHYYKENDGPTKGKEFFKQTGLFSTSFQRFFEGGNVVGYEFDQLIQGSSLNEEESARKIGLHFPFGCIASGSACMVGFMEKEKSDKFRGDPECKQQCQSYIFELKNKWHGDMNHGVYQKGTTAFYAYDIKLLKTAFQHLQSLKNPRVVYSLRMPV